MQRKSVKWTGGKQRGTILHRREPNCVPYSVDGKSVEDLPLFIQCPRCNNLRKGYGKLIESVAPPVRGEGRLPRSTHGPHRNRKT